MRSNRRSKGMPRRGAFDGWGERLGGVARISGGGIVVGGGASVAIVGFGDPAMGRLGVGRWDAA